MDLELTGKNVLIVGGAAGIGLACAQRFMAEGAMVIVWDLAEVSQSNFINVQCDITNKQSVEAALNQTMMSVNSIDCLVHTAAVGSGYFGFPFDNVPIESWSKVLDVNITGMAQVAYAVAPQMIKQRSGSMVFLSSVAGQIGSQTDPPYSASKAANLNFAICLARDLARHHVRVNSVCPGMVKTSLNRSVWQAWFNQAEPEDRMDYDAWAEEKIRKVCPLGRWQSTDDIADTILFLSSARAAQITGQAINVDGGFVMRM
ncbi:MAG: SDR family oxidoreductase [Pirellulales bacterium]